MNIEKIKVNTVAGMLLAVARKKHPFQALLDWLSEEKGLTGNQLAEKSGAFGRSALTMQAKKEHPNPGLDMIHGIARVAKIPEQVVIDACLGRPFPGTQELQNAILKEIFRKYQMINPENRSDSLTFTLDILTKLIDECLEAQEATKTKR